MTNFQSLKPHLYGPVLIKYIREGMSFVDGRLETLRQRLQDGRKSGHHKDLLAANQQVDYGIRG